MASEDKKPQAPKVAIASVPEPVPEETSPASASAERTPLPAAPAPRVEEVPAAQPADAAADGQGVQGGQDARDAHGAQEQRTVAENISRMGSATRGFLSSIAPGHEHAVLCGLLGLLVACLVFWIGIPRTLVLCLFGVVGVAVGQALDGDPKILKAIVRLVNHGER